MKKLLLAFLSMVTFAFSVLGQNQVTGAVKDEKGEPLIGVSIQIKGTTSGTTTDNKGAYTLNIPATVTDPVLIFSYIGFASQEIAVAGQKNIAVTTINSAEMMISSRPTPPSRNAMLSIGSAAKSSNNR